jgi:hypothetical protein
VEVGNSEYWSHAQGLFQGIKGRLMIVSPDKELVLLK